MSTATEAPPQRHRPQRATRPLAHPLPPSPHPSGPIRPTDRRMAIGQLAAAQSRIPRPPVSRPRAGGGGVSGSEALEPPPAPPSVTPLATLSAPSSAPLSMPILAPRSDPSSSAGVAPWPPAVHAVHAAPAQYAQPQEQRGYNPQQPAQFQPGQQLPHGFHPSSGPLGDGGGYPGAQYGMPTMHAMHDLARGPSGQAPNPGPQPHSYLGGRQEFYGAPFGPVAQIGRPEMSDMAARQYQPAQPQQFFISEQQWLHHQAEASQRAMYLPWSAAAAAAAPSGGSYMQYRGKEPGADAAHAAHAAAAAAGFYGGLSLSPHPSGRFGGAFPGGINAGVPPASGAAAHAGPVAAASYYGVPSGFPGAYPGGILGMPPGSGAAAGGYPGPRRSVMFERHGSGSSAGGYLTPSMRAGGGPEGASEREMHSGRENVEPKGVGLWGGSKGGSGPRVRSTPGDSSGVITAYNVGALLA